MNYREILFSATIGFCFGFALFCFQLKDPRVSRAPSSTRGDVVACHLRTPDGFEIVGHGSDRNEAFADAAEKCYLRSEAKFDKLHKDPGNMDEGEKMVVSCVNLSCRYDVSSL